MLLTGQGEGGAACGHFPHRLPMSARNRTSSRRSRQSQRARGEGHSHRAGPTSKIYKPSTGAPRVELQELKRPISYCGKEGEPV